MYESAQLLTRLYYRLGGALCRCIICDLLRAMHSALLAVAYHVV